MRQTWRSCVALISVAMGASVLCAGQDAGDTKAAPSAVVSPMEFAFGEVWELAVVSRDFTITNSGNAPLTVKVKSSCGCTPVTQPKSPLAPGESDTFRVRYDTRKIGPANKYVMVLTNDPVKPELKFPVRGTVKPIYARRPAQTVRFDCLTKTTAATEAMRLENKYGRKVNLKLAPDQDFKPFAVELAEVEAGMVYELRVSTIPPMPDGYNKTAIRLNTGLPEAPTLTVNVFGQVNPRVVTQPKEFLIYPAYKEARRRPLRLQYWTAHPIKLLDVRMGDKPAIYTRRNMPPAPKGSKVDGHMVDVEIPGYDDIPEEGLTLVVLTDDKEERFQRIEVPIKRGQYKRKMPAKKPADAAPAVKKTPAKPATPAPAPEPAKKTPKSADGVVQPIGAAPKLQISETEFDFGEVWVGQPAKHDFKVKNVGHADLTLVLKTSCGCTVVTKPHSPLEPGKSTSFSVSYRTTSAAKANKSVTLVTNDMTQASVRIPIRGVVKDLFERSPSTTLTFPGIQAPDARTRTVSLENKYKKPLTLKLKEGQAFGRFEIALKEVRPGQVYELTATTRPPLAIGANRASVVLETGLEEVPTITVPVNATVQPLVTISPQRMYVPTNTAAPKQRLTVRYPSARKVEIVGIEVDGRKVEYRIVPLKPGQNHPRARTARHIVEVSMPAAADLPAKGAELVVVTNDREPAYQRLAAKVLPRDRTRPAGRTPKSGPDPALPTGAAAKRD